jgi:uncharacterized protein (TIGR02001 family)
MKKMNALLAAALSLSSVTVTLAEEAKPDWTITGNAGLYSDYRFRGFTQTGYEPAFQGGFDVAHTSGFYVGNWNSNVESGLYRGASLEMDLYGGYKYNLGPVALDAGLLHYYYPSSNKNGNKGVKQTEIYLGTGYDIFSAKLSYGFTNFFGLGDGTSINTKGNYYLDLGIAKDLGNGWGVSGHYGYQYVKHGKDAGLVANNVSDYRVGATKDLSGWTAGAALVATSKKDFALTAAGKDGGKTGIVLSLGKTF